MIRKLPQLRKLGPRDQDASRGGAVGLGHFSPDPLL